MKTVLMVAAAMLASATPLLADEEIVVDGQDQQAVNVTIYTRNLALVKDRRTVDLPRGTRTLAFREVSAQIKPETAVMQGRDLKVLEQNFEYDLLTPQSLLQKYVGREITLRRQQPVTGEERSVQAKVLSAGDGVVLQVGNQIETDVNGHLIFPDVPDTLRDRPTLTMQVESGAVGTREVELSYLTAGLSWRADYVAELNAADDRLDLSGWVTLINESGARYPQARLQLVAGDVNLAPQPMPVQMHRREAMVMASAPKALEEESMFEYHLYSLERPTTIGENQKKQVALLKADGVACRKEYLLKGQEHYFRARIGEIGQKMKVGVFVEVRNDKDAGLGRPLPGGVVRVYKKDSNGGLQFVGEDTVDHTPEKELVRLHLGEAFDITADKVQTDFKQLKVAESSGVQYESEYAIRLKNAKKEAVVVTVQEPIPGDWQILSESSKHRKESAHLASWLVTVPPLDSATLTYRVSIRN
ncbi:MAG: DUF4139 domain-containing protein [Desulfobulbus sp.]|jgi:hypothetical protein|uniref:DUF4139 domain-containing protein n=1 Tax=Desulfobulbus sp. TaxID=895 RepID=UPI0028465575|nr:DUF4139 domain-containing protein [Desulfobulbus sp.]MDR2548778.1 DUF4139 domain-containing protein [Desulfobulbus sp.]